ncbi:MAG: NADH-quinone oxidoreductase subunit NuoH [Chloroflexi bacterium]|nr:NADH-quinone oxidoreductase subunit NuoH [Chloroflexota bacterium]
MEQVTLVGQLFTLLLNFLPQWAAYLVAGLVGMLAIITFVLLMVMGFIWIERRGLSRFQIRIGPNRVGPFGLLQPVADAIKVLLKEDIVPARAARTIFALAPLINFLPVLLIFAVIPMAGDGAVAVLANLNIGVLYIMAISGASILAIFMAGWASNNKYALIGAMRAVSQMVSYEVPVVLSLVGIIMLTGSLSLVDIVERQNVPFFLLQPLGFIIFFIAAIAEINRAPFDLLEADSEIVAGYHIEYSGMKFAMFFLAEYGHAVIFSALITTLFLGGWKGPLLPPFLWFVIKLLVVFWVVFWIRATVPRLRVDQLSALAWKALLPLSLINIAITGVQMLIWPAYPAWLVPVNLAIFAMLILLWSRLFSIGQERRPVEA